MIVHLMCALSKFEHVQSWYRCTNVQLALLTLCGLVLLFLLKEWAAVNSKFNLMTIICYRLLT
jgi:hypothetical protein